VPVVLVVLLVLLLLQVLVVLVLLLKILVVLVLLLWETVLLEGTSSMEDAPEGAAQTTMHRK
jgi:hypothetical protein